MNAIIETPCPNEGHACCCNCQHRLKDYTHCTTVPGRQPGECLCGTLKGFICNIPEYDGAFSGWSEHGECELHDWKSNYFPYILNGKRLTWRDNGTTYSYEEICKAIGVSPDFNPSVSVVIGDRSLALSHGQSITMEPKTIINALVTGNA